MKKRKGLYIATATIVAAIAGTLVMANGGIKLHAQPLSAEKITSSVTFSSFTTVNKQATKTASLTNGGTIRAYGTASATGGEMNIGTANYAFFEYVNNGTENDSITVNSTSRSMAKFQSITSVTVVCSYGNATVNYSSDGTSWNTASSGSSLSNAKYVYLNASSNTWVTSITLNYSCSPDGEGGDDDYSDIISSLEAGNGRWTASIPNSTTYTPAILNFKSKTLSYTYYGSETWMVEFDYNINSESQLILTVTKVNASVTRFFVKSNGTSSVGDQVTVAITGRVTSLGCAIYYSMGSVTTKNLTFSYQN